MSNSHQNSLCQATLNNSTWGSSLNTPWEFKLEKKTPGHSHTHLRRFPCFPIFFSSYILTFLHLIHPITLTYKTMRITYQNISFQILIYCQIFRPISIDMRINLKTYANITPSTIEYLPLLLKQIRFSQYNFKNNH